MRTCWQQYSFASNDLRNVLSPIQKNILWNRIISADQGKNDQTILWNRQGSVNQAINAWELVHHYQLEPANWKSVSDDCDVFIRWYQQYNKKLREASWLDSAHLTTIMIAADFIPEGSVILLDFTVFNPAQRQWINHLQKRDDSKVSEVCIASEKATDQVNLYTDFEQEIKAIAVWARKTHQDNPAARIGIVVPELAQSRRQIELVFNRVFSPRFDTQNNQYPAYQFSIDDSLSQSGLVDAALNGLALLHHRFDYQIFSLFLRNLYLKGDESDQSAYALWDAKIRKYAQPDVSVSIMIRLLESMSDEHLPSLDTFIERLTRLMQYVKTLPDKASPTVWCDYFFNALTILGWPNFEQLDTFEKLELKYWDQLLTSLCATSLVEPQVTMPQALHRLNELAANTPMKQNSGSPAIQVMDLNQSAAAYFDYAWISGLTDSVLPKPVKLNALIPFSIQRSAGVRFSSAQSCQEMAQHQFNQLAHLSDNLIFSAYTNNSDTALRLSPLLRDCNEMHQCDNDEAGFVSHSEFKLEHYRDDTGLEFQENKLKGGTYLLKCQANCPFESYANYRLKVAPLETPEPGLDAAIRGALLHDVLANVWNELKDHSGLLQLDEQERTQLLSKHIDAAVLGLKGSQQHFSPIEKKRLLEMTQKWLEFESQREPFKVVQLELLSTFAASDVELDIKIDRVDQLQDGQQIIFDYKTGSTTLSDWAAERVLDPQLPVYYLALKNQAHAIAFAKPKEFKMLGLSEDAIPVDGIGTVDKSKSAAIKNFLNWDALVNHWQQTVHSLINEYQRGHALVAPQKLQHCQYCARQALCRIDQQGTSGENDE